MKHIIFDEAPNYKIAILIKDAAFNKKDLEQYYVNKTTTPANEIIGFNLKYKDNGKAPAGFAREYLEVLLKALDNLQVTTLFVCDSDYFKVLTKVKKVDGCLGYIHPCTMKNYEHMNVILCANYKALFFNPTLQSNIDLSLRTLENHMNGFHVEIGSDIIHSAEYPSGYNNISTWLGKLHQYPELTCDVETTSLKFYETGIKTISFAWDKYNGIAFDVSLYLINDDCIKNLLINFFKTYKGKLTYHNANFDLKIIISDLFMEHLLDQKGMVEGIDVMTRSIDDTKLITYLATNSTAGNKLKLKHQAHEFAGNYAVDVTDITKIDLQDLLEYNLIDCLSTWYVKEKHYPTMVQDNQLSVYNKIFIPSVKNILQMELTGMPLDMPQVYKAQTELRDIVAVAHEHIFDSPIVIKFIGDLRKEECLSCNLKWKTKRKDLSYFDYVNFNPASNPQLADLLYERIGLPVIDRTKTKQPAVGGKTLKKLINHTKDVEVTALLNDLITLAEASKILNTFIKAFIENSVLKADGIWYLHGNFNLGGTVSGRLSSSGPNLQNIPSHSKYAKIIKACFIAPSGWLMCGADFDSLEDKISALTTKDPNKLRVYTEKYDGHSLRAYSYFGEYMNGIENTVDSINSIADLYPDFRQESKGPTFALTYQGTWHTLVNSIGLDEAAAKAIEKSYHELYVVADEWVQDRLIEASDTGYVTTAFGLRIRTPILKQTILGKNSTPYEAQSESRTAGNGLGQGYGQLTNRAGIEFQEKVLASKYWDKIKPIAQIHDALYFIVKNELGTIKWFNDNLPACMSWQELPEIQHDIVKLSGSVEIFYPNWANKIKLPNHSTKHEILKICQDSVKKIKS